MPCPTWTVDSEVAQASAAQIVTECDLGTIPQGEGIILRSPSGAMYTRFHVDDDGAILFDPLGASYAGDEFVFHTPGTGPCLYPVSDSGPVVRIRVDEDGVGGTEPASFDWTIGGRPLYGADVDVIVLGVGSGVLFTTPNGLHVYRVKVDTDAITLGTELVS